jgi:hypothetical protein
MALDGGEWSASSSGGFTPGARPAGTYWIRGRVGTRAGLDAVERRTIPCTIRESNPGSLALNPSLYRRAIPTHKYLYKNKLIDKSIHIIDK